MPRKDRDTKAVFQARVSRRRILKTPEQREAAIQRLLRKPPARIQEKVVTARRARVSRTYPKTWRDELRAEQKSKCYWCGRRLDRDNMMTIDHLIPLSKGGKNARTNVVGSCGPCNQAKADRTPEEFEKMAGKRREAMRRGVTLPACDNDIKES